MSEFSSATWRKSSYSGPTNDDCVEVAHDVPGIGRVAVRDSKDVERGALMFGQGAWANFVAEAASQGA